MGKTAAGGFTKRIGLEEYLTLTDSSLDVGFRVTLFIPTRTTFVCGFLRTGIGTASGKEATTHSTYPAGVCSPKERAEQVRPSAASQFIEASTSVNEQIQGLCYASGDATIFGLPIRNECACTECLYDFCSSGQLGRSVRFEPDLSGGGTGYVYS